MTFRRIAVLLFVLPFLASCGGGDSPTQPTAPPVVVGPAQPTVEIVVTQATSSSVAVDSAGPPQRDAAFIAGITVRNPDNSAAATARFVEALIFFSEGGLGFTL